MDFVIWTKIPTIMRSQRAFIADLSAEILEAQLRDLGCAGPFPGDPGTPAGVEAALALIKGLGDEARGRWDANVGRAEDLADEDGVLAILLAADAGRGKVETLFRARRGPRDFALWHLLHRPEEFASAEAIRYSDRRRDKSPYWDGYAAGAAPGLTANAIDLEALAVAMREVLQAGDQQRIDIEIIDRPENKARAPDERLIQVSVWREGSPRIIEHFADAGRRRDTYRPSIGAAVLFNPQTGALDVMLDRGGGRLRRRLAQAFCDAVLGRDAPAPIGSRPVDLTSLRTRRSFAAGAADPIEEVTVVGITIERGVEEGLLHFDAPAAGDIWKAAASWGIPLETVEITRAVIAVRFAAMPGYPEPRTKKVKLARPAGCSLAHWSDLERAIGERLLAEWGLRPVA